MKCLLDTHILLWFLNGEALSEQTKRLIINGVNYISIVSLWEVAIKMNIGKYEFNGGFSMFKNLVKDNGFNILPMKTEYMEMLFELPLIHRDPFDRIIIAASMVEELPLITADENIRKYNIEWYGR